MRALFVLLMMSLLPISCSREQEQTAPPVSTEKNLFEELKEQTIKNPRDAEAWFHLADVYERSGMYREEVDALHKVIAIDPRRGYVHMKLGNSYNRLGQYQEAIKSYTKAIKFLPQNPVLHNNLAISYGKVGKVNEEITELEKAVSLRPRYATARYNLGVMKLNRGDRQGALKQYNEIKQFDEGIAAALKKEIDERKK